MGGKPWTSKGCVDCRRRKIKCDEQRPECGRCLKSGIKCQGWEEHRNFVGAGSILEARRQKSNTVTTKPHRGCQVESWSIQGQRPPQGSRSAAPPLPKLPVVVHSAQAVRAQVFASFLQHYFSSTPVSSSINLDDSILRSIGSLSHKSPMTERALSAISCIYLGKTNDNTSIINHGLSLYHTAIRQMSHMIHRGVYTNDICYTVFLFQGIDSIHAPYGLTSWGTHIAGMNTLLPYYRSKSSNDPIMDTIYSHWQKLQIIFSSTGMNLSKSEYDYLMEPANGDPLLEVIQMTVAIGDLESLCLSLDLSLPDPMACRALVQKCYDIQDVLMEMWKSGRFGQEPWPSQRRNDPEILSPEPLFGFAYDFSSPNHAVLYIMFWTNLVFLQSLIGRTNSRARPHARSTAGVHASLHMPLEDVAFVHPDKYADKVARALCYCLQDSMKLSLIKEAVYGLAVIGIRYVTTANYEKHRWCVRALRYLGARGFDTASHMSKLAAAKWEQELGCPVPLTSLRKAKSSDWNSNPVPLLSSKSERTMGHGSMYHRDDPSDVDEISESSPD